MHRERREHSEKNIHRGLGAAVLSGLVLVPAAGAQAGHLAEGGVPWEWTQTYGELQSGHNSAYEVVARGTRAFTAIDTLAGPKPGAAFVCLDLKTGDELWRNQLELPGTGSFGQEAVARFGVSRDGSCVVGVQRGGPVEQLVFSQDKHYLFAFASISGLDGTTQLSTLLPHPKAGKWIQPEQVLVAHDGSAAFILGSRVNSNYEPELWIEALAANTAEVLWTVQLGATAVYSRTLRAASLSLDGSRLHVAVQKTYPNDRVDLEIETLSTSTGAALWTAVLKSDCATQGGWSIGQDPSTRLVLTAVRADPGQDLFALDPDSGAIVWRAPLVGDVHSLGIGTDGGPIFAGTSVTQTVPHKGVSRVAAFDANTGAELWFAEHDGPAESDHDMPIALRVPPGGSGVLVAEAHLVENGFDPDQRSLRLLDACSGQERWGFVYDGLTAQGLQTRSERAMALNEDGGLVLAARSAEHEAHPSSGDDGAIEAWTVGAGRPAWSAVLDVEVGIDEHPADIALDAQGGVLVVTGGSDFAPLDSLTLGLHAATGTHLWQLKRHQGRGGSDLAVHPEGERVYLLEPRDYTSFGFTTRISALTTQAGQLLWETVLPHPEISDPDHTARFSLSPSGDRIACGEPGKDPLLTMLDAGNGSVLWQEINDLSLGMHALVATEFSEDGDVVYLVGFFYPPVYMAPGTADATLVVARDAQTGALKWTLEGEGGGAGVAFRRYPLDCAVADGVLYLAEKGAPPGQTQEAVVRAVDGESGAVLWQRAVSKGDKPATPVSISSAGGRVLVGAQLDNTSPNGNGYFTFALDAVSGELLWSDSHDKSTWDHPSRGALSADGATWTLTGETRKTAAQASSSDMLTIAWDAASGERLWLARWDGGFQEDGVALVADPAGERLVLAGSVAPAGQGPDCAVVSYRTPALMADPPEVPIGGGSQALTLRAGAARAGHLHLVLGSASGDFPGTPLGSEILPLNVDEYFLLTVSRPGDPIAGALGTLSETGGASASFDLPVGAPASLVGRNLHHAYVAIDLSGPNPALSLVSNAVAVQIQP